MTATPRPLPSTVAHLDSLVATGAEDWLVISAKVPGAKSNGDPGWRSKCFRPDQVDDAAATIAAVDARGLNVYLRTTLIGEPIPAHRRGGKHDTSAVVALTIDLDIAGPGHAPTQSLPLPPDITTAKTILRALPPASIENHTGGGLQLWYLLDEPVTEDCVALVERWGERVVEAGRRSGWHVDSPDAARVLRPAGTHRRKPNIPVNPVVMTAVAGWPDPDAPRPWCPAGRYSASDLIEALPAPPPPIEKPPRQPRPEGEIGPADAVSTLTWAEILEPLGWTFVGHGWVGGDPVDHWLRPGDASTDYSAKATDSMLLVHSPAAGFPRADGHGYNKWQAFTWLCFGGDMQAAGREIRRRSKAAA